MSRPAAATQQKPEPRIRRARFAEEDLVSTFGEAMLAEARALVGAGAVDLTTTGPAIEATIVAVGDAQKVIDDLHRKIGQLQVERDFLAGQPAISRFLRGGR